MIKYYNTLSTEMYFKEDEKERHHNLRIIYMFSKRRSLNE